MLNDIPIVTAVCNEPEGPIVRYVYPMPFSPENMQKFWYRAKKYPQIFGIDVKDFKHFCELFISSDGDIPRAHGLCWVLDDFVGVYYMNRMTQTEAHVHYSFFDRRAKGREEITKEMLRYVFRRYGFWRLNVEIPEQDSKSPFGFTMALGFKKEGFKSGASRLKGMPRKNVCFGLVREDILSPTMENS